NVDNRIDGAVLALYDIDLTKRHDNELRSTRDYAEAVFQTMRDGLVVLDDDLRIQRVNKAFCDAFHVTPDEVAGRFFYEIDHGQWDSPQLRCALSEVLPEKKVIERLDIEHQFPSLGLRAMRVNARRLQKFDGGPGLILLAIEDVTGRQE